MTEVSKMSVEDVQAIGNRLQAARETKNLTVEQVSEALHVPPFSIRQVELDTGQASTEVFMGLVQFYGVSLYEILNGPHPYKTEQEWLEAHRTGKITEDDLASGLGLDLVAARAKANAYEFTESLKPENWTETKGLTTPEFKTTLRPDGSLSFMFTLDLKSRYRAVISAGSTQALAMFLRDNVQVPEPPTQESVDALFKGFEPHRVTE